MDLILDLFWLIAELFTSGGSDFGGQRKAKETEPKQKVIILDRKDR